MVDRVAAHFKRDLLFQEDLDLTVTGDLSQVEGIENLRQAIYNRLVTVAGTIANRPNYGIGIKRFQNRLSTLDGRRQLMLSIQEQFESDDRIEEVTGLAIDQDQDRPDQFTIRLTIRPVALEPLDFTFRPFINDLR